MRLIGPGPGASSHGAMLVVSALIAGSFSLGAMAAPHIMPLALTLVRFVLAGCLLWLFLRLKRQHIPSGAFAAPWRYVILGGLFALYFTLMFEGLKTAPPVSAAAVFATTPLMTVGFGWLILGQRPTRRMALAVSVAAIGAVWVIFRADLGALLAFELGRGEAIYFIGCVAHALYIPLVRRFNRGEGELVFTLGTILGAIAGLGLVGLPAVLATDWAALPPIVWGTIGYTAVFATVATFTLTQFASLRIPAANVMAYSYIVPVWVIVLEFALHAPLPPLMILPGIGLVVAALLAMLGEGRAAQERPAR